MDRPRLWNPNAAANWSLLLTPGFGALLHAANWRVLGQPERAKANIFWFWITLGFMFAVIASMPLPQSTAVDLVFRAVGLGLLVGWYFNQGKPQIKLVKEQFGKDYQKRGWLLVLPAGFAATLGFMVVAIAVGLLTYSMTPEELADSVEPVIIEQWESNPEIRSATLHSLTLKQTVGDVYHGQIEATINGDRLLIPIQVDNSGLRTAWELGVPKPAAPEQ